MKNSALATLYRFELKMLLRDKRTVLLSIVLPVLVMPLLLFSSSLLERSREKRQEEKTYHYAVTGGEAALARRLIAAWRPDAEAEGPSLKLEELFIGLSKADLEHLSSVISRALKKDKSLEDFAKEARLPLLSTEDE